MKTVAQRIWNEPAVFVGLLVTLGLLIVNIIGHTEWSGQEVVEVLAPLASALGIRQLVVPATKASRGDVPKQGGTTYQKLEPR